MKAFLRTAGMMLLVGAAVLAWLVLIPLLDCLRSDRETSPGEQPPFEEVPTQPRSLQQAA